jgi:DNA recombination protein RmuC
MDTWALIVLSGFVISSLVLVVLIGLNRVGRRSLDDRLASLLRDEVDRIRSGGEEQARGLRQELANSLHHFQDSTLKAFDDSAARHTAAAKELREELTTNFGNLGGPLTETLGHLGAQQKERLENVSMALDLLTQKHERTQAELKQSVEARLDAIRTENAAKLDEMRNTVDEKLQTTLESRLGQSFNRVVEQLERVHKGIGEMQTLAAGVGDLKKVLSNVRIRGTFGELQLGALLEQFLSPEQLIKNAQVKENTQERVEYAIKLPGRDETGDVLLPLDAKFPQEDYERLLAAAEASDNDAVAAAASALEGRIRSCAKTIMEKYIVPPRTTDFAILFLPTESLYAEVLRRPGLFDGIQRDYHVTLAGPTTLIALLNALQMGFRSLAIEKRSSEVWRILGAVRNEFGKYNDVVDRLARQLDTAAKSVETLGVRTRVMSRKLQDVEQLPDATSQILLGSEVVTSGSVTDDAKDRESGNKHHGAVNEIEGVAP